MASILVGIKIMTDYAGAYQYEDEKLTFIMHSEGRIVPKRDGNNTIDGFVYQYHITDQLGNVRTLFSSESKSITFEANMEADAEDQIDDDLFFGIDSKPEVVATSGTNAARLLAGQIAGPSIVLPVYPGDEIEMSVNGWYRNGDGSADIDLNALITALAGAFGGVDGVSPLWS